MKKLLFIAIFSLVGVTAFAQEIENIDIEEEATEEIATVQDVYAEIMMDALPDEVNAALGENHPNASIDKAYWNEENMKYKLDVSMEDGTSSSVYIDKEGNFVDEQ